MPRDSAAADRPASYLVGTAAAFPLFFRDRTKPVNQLPFSPSAKFPKSGSSCESRARASRLFRDRDDECGIALQPDLLPAFEDLFGCKGHPSSGQSRNTARALSIAPGC